MKITAPAIRYHGAKFRLAPWIMTFFPAHTCYVEPFGGAAGVLLQKPRAYAEVYNDLDGEIVNFFRVLRDPTMRARLIEVIALTPYHRDEFDLAWKPTRNRVEQARRTCVRAMMGFGSAGATKGSTGFRIDTKREYGTAQHSWVAYPGAIAAAGERFTGVLIENRSAIEVMQQHDGPDTLHFVDPPYLHSTRVMQSRNTGSYRHEMTDADHAAMLEVVKQLTGMVVLCGYPNPLYDEALSTWSKHSTVARISAGRGTTHRTECVWINPSCANAIEAERAQGRLFA
ncbi:MAG TPA: DNA adenine methylase [Fluviicoccus sp.]|nr:DNA adenine methylase [Fluviicoccus sp.]